MLPTEFRAIGEALFGPQWQSEIARHLGVSHRTVRRWRAGKFIIPRGAIDKMAQMLEERRKLLKTLEAL